MNSLKRHVGKFKISTLMIENEPDMVLKALSKVIPVRVEHLFYEDAFEYIGLSYEFDYVGIGEMIPTYLFTVNRDESGNHFVSYKKVQPNEHSSK